MKPCPWPVFGLLLVALLSQAPGRGEAASCQVDLMLSLDRSASMKKSDPDRRVTDLVAEIARLLEPGDRVGVVTFHEVAEALRPLVSVVDGRGISVTDDVSGLEYTGSRTSIGTGIERAFYELKRSARPDATAVVLLLTDGVIDLPGGATASREQHRWIVESLAPEMRDRGVVVFGVALTDAADFQLLQEVARLTQGDYVRVLSASDLPGAAADLFRLVEARCEARRAARAPAPTSASTGPVKDEAPAGRVVVAPPVSPPPAPRAPQPVREAYVGGDAPARSAGWLPWALGGLVAAALTAAAVVFLRRRSRPAPRAADRRAGLQEPPSSQTSNTFVLPDADPGVPSDASACPPTFLMRDGDGFGQATVAMIEPCTVCGSRGLVTNCARCRTTICTHCLKEHNRRRLCPSCYEHEAGNTGKRQL